ncbi:hybrid sensor histidine kinase/response regulator [Pararhizobium antarcticum]|uniref:histidine kinase n=1 Tax=Pararhizobium antarcticum TaxID=1798805 RepID=A0A657LXJ9_9HYPH|nr:hybrid sensor histidine kinase/response regulator [Pararhizobium antarcticum]OJF91117.1 hybrid sensor histidine kinase/response regulator [Rhizobium sp. 58]OJG00044.1 hybrid sensor histidine kinase/response regulator [Pararhizobium antarcticum]
MPSSVNPIAIIFTPDGRDAEIATSLLSETGIQSRAVANIVAFAAALDDGTALAVVTEETIRSSNLKALADWVAEQPAWSDLPFVVLTRRGGDAERNPSAARLSEILGNVTFIERPFHATTFISVARSALRGRLRQLEARSLLDTLREGEGRLQTALQAGHLGAWELDIARMSLTASDTCKSIFGRRASEPFGYDALLGAVHPDDLDRMQMAVRHTLETGRDYAIEYRIVWPDRTVHWVDIRAQLYRQRNTMVEKLVGVSSDITTRKLWEEELKRLNDTLEERVALRTAELKASNATLVDQVAQRERAEEQLRQSQKMEAIGQLTGGVAHDFNNLLMAVLGNLELLAKHCAGDPKTLRLVEGAMQGAKRGASLTQRLLAFARRQDLKVEPVDLKTLVAGMSDLLARSVGPNVRVAMALPDTLPLTLVDGNQVELALLNLAVNARDAMPDGGAVSVSLRHETLALTQKDLAAGGYVVLSVEDTGHGMSKQTLSKAIDPFFSTKEVGKGTGLGLSMIHGLAVQLNGGLKLTSTVGEGTKAELWLPSTLRQAEQGVTVAPNSGTGEQAPLRILMVDDDALIAMSSVDMLEDLGHLVTEANSGMAALELLEKGEEFDLVITDYSMPGMTGAELARAARALLPQLPIMIASGYADLPPGAGIDLPRLSKPYSQAQLEAEITKVVSARH